MKKKALHMHIKGRKDSDIAIKLGLPVSKI
jgi:hypothetical protein